MWFLGNAATFSQSSLRIGSFVDDMLGLQVQGVCVCVGKSEVKASRKLNDSPDSAQLT